MALGVIAATAASRPILAPLVGALSAFDPLSFAGTTAMLAVVAIGGLWIWRGERRESIHDGAATTAETEVDC